MIRIKSEEGRTGQRAVPLSKPRRPVQVLAEVERNLTRAVEERTVGIS